MKYFVEVVTFENDDVVKMLGPMSEAKAKKVDDGIQINLNHEEYYTRIVLSVENDQEETG